MEAKLNIEGKGYHKRGYAMWVVKLSTKKIQSITIKRMDNEDGWKRKKEVILQDGWRVVGGGDGSGGGDERVLSLEEVAYGI